MSAITINGKSYPVELTDLYVIRDLMDAVEMAQQAQEGADLAFVIQFAEVAKSAIARAIGQENAAEAFGDRLLLSVIKDAISQIADEVGPAYNKMLLELAE
jgi:hypothetical protein